MSLRKITLLVVGLTFLGLVAFLTFALETSLLRHFINVEEQMVFISVQRAVGVINGDFDHLLATANEWSDREDLIRFMQQPDPGFVQNNLTDRTYSDLKANLLVFVNQAGVIVYSKGIDLTSRQEIPVPPELLSHLVPGDPLLDSGFTGKQGLLETSQGPLMLVAQPVLPSGNNPTPVGTMFIGRFLSPSEILRLGGVIQMPIRIEPYNSPNLTPEFMAARQVIGTENAYVAIPLLEDQIGGYAVLNDVFDQPAYLLMIQQRRVIYQNGQLLMRYLIIALLAAGLIFGLSSMYTLETLVLSRLSRLSSEVNSIGASGDISSRVTVKRQDELSSLSENINRMLAILEQAQHTQAELQASLSERLEEQNALYESSQVFLSQLDKATNLQNICQSAVNRFGLDVAQVWECERDSGWLIPAATCGCPTEMPALERLAIDAPEHQNHPVIKALQTNSTGIVATNGSTPTGEFPASAAFPLLNDGSLFAVLLLHSREPSFFSPERVQTLQSFANLSGMALRNAQLFEQVRAGQRSMETLSRRLVEVQEEERKYIAMELHDEIGQILTGLRLMLNLNISGVDQKTLDRLQQSKELVNELIGRVRQMSLELRPGLLDDLGLIPTLLWHFEGYTNHTGIQVQFQHANLDGERFSFNIETTAYRVIQEALTNVARHADVREVSVWAGIVPGFLRIEVEDQGAGFNTEKLFTNGNSRGLLGIRERVNFVRGSVTIHSTPGEGTRLTIQIPLETTTKGEVT